MNRYGKVNPKFLILGAAIMFVMIVSVIVFVPSSNVSDNDKQILTDENGNVIGDASKGNSENKNFASESHQGEDGTIHTNVSGSHEKYLGKSVGGVMEGSGNGSADDAITGIAGKDKGQKAKVAIWGKSGSPLMGKSSPESASIGAEDSIAGKKAILKPKKVGQCFLATYSLKGKGNETHRLKLDSDSLNKKSICVRVDGAPVKHKITKKGDVIVASTGSSKELTVRYCVDDWNCNESCKVADDDFMSAIGGLGKSLNNGQQNDSGWDEKGKLAGDEKKLDREIKGLRKQIEAFRKKEGNRVVSRKAKREIMTCKSRLVRRKAVTAKR